MSTSLPMGAGGDLRFSSLRGRTEFGRARAGIRYPSPFFDIGHTYLPPQIKSLLRWCRYYFYTNPLINAAVTKMAAYPITDLHYDTESVGLHHLWDDLLMRKLGLRAFMFGVGLDYFAYGNAFIGISFPFIKLLICQKCGESRPIQEMDYKFRSFKYEGTCSRCLHYGDFTVYDKYIRSSDGINLMRWNPEDIDIDYKSYNGKKRILYNIPIQLRNDIRLGKRHIIEDVPDIYVRSVEKNKALLLHRVYHFANQSIAQDVRNMGWGISMMLPVLKDTYYMQMLRKAQEMIAQEHIVPLRILFPQPGSGTSDPYCIVPWGLVETKDGLRRAEDVSVGDLLKSHTGKWQRVEEAVTRPIRVDENVYSIQFKSMPSFPLEVSEEHPVLCARGAGRGFDGISEPDWVDAKDIEEGDFVCYPTYRKISSQESITLDAIGLPATDRHVYGRMSEGTARAFEYFEDTSGEGCKWGELSSILVKIGCDKGEYQSARACYSAKSKPCRVPIKVPICEELATLLGYYAAEGSVSGSQVSFGLHKDETGVCDEIDSIVHRLFGIGPGGRYAQEGKGLNYVVGSKILAHFLSHAVGKGFDKKVVPRFIQEAPDNVLLAFMRALFFGDGCFFVSGGNVRVSLKLANLPLIAKVRELLLTMGHLGLLAKYTPRERDVSKAVSYSLNYNGNEGLRLAKAFGWSSGGLEESPLRANRSGFFRDGYVYLRVARTGLIHADSVIGFQMEGDRSFCAFGVATHNSNINLSNWKERIKTEVEAWKLDPNHMFISPIPIGSQTIGGDGRALLLSQEMRLVEEAILAGLKVPVEFVKGGTCLAPDALIQTSKGLIRIDEVTPEEEGACFLDIQVPTHEGVKGTLLGHNVGQKTVSLTTGRSGMQLRSAKTHPVLVLQRDMSMQFKRIEELSLGDHIAVKVGAELWPEEVPRIDYAANISDACKPVQIPSVLTKELARLLGYLVAEGCCTEDKRVGFTNSCEEVLDDYQQCVRAVLGLETVRVSKGEVLRDTHNPCWSIEISRQHAVGFMKYLGVWGYSNEKTIPWIIKKAPKELVVEFLKAYYEGDGGVVTLGGGSRRVIVATSTSSQLLKEVQLLLLNMGILSTLYSPKKRKIWDLYIRSASADVFASTVGFVSNAKKELISTMPPAKKEGSLSDRIPYLKELLEKITEEYFGPGKSRWIFCPTDVTLEQDEYSVDEIAALVNRKRSTICIYLKKGSLKGTMQGKRINGRFAGWKVTRADLQSFLLTHGFGERHRMPNSQWEMNYTKLKKLDTSFLQQYEPGLARNLEVLKQEKFYWDEVVALEETDELVEMRDLTVDIPNSYQANGMIVHNSFGGTALSMHILKNQFEGYRRFKLEMVQNFIIREIAYYMGWPTVKVRLKRFHMADDLQRASLSFQLNQAAKISDKTLLEELNYDVEEETQIIKRESAQQLQNMNYQQAQQAHMQGEAMKIQTRYQQSAMAEQQPQATQPELQTEHPQAVQSQLGPTAPLQPAQIDRDKTAKHIARQLAAMPEQEMYANLKTLQPYPEIHTRVTTELNNMRGRPNSAAKPLPEQKPPRRGPSEAIM